MPVAAALTIRLFQLLHPGSLFGLTEYDDGVYLGQAIRLVGGHLPYRDFVAVNPPGMMVLLSPVGALAGLVGTDVALAVARVITVVVDVTDVVLVGVILRRHGRAAQVVAMAIVALYPGEVGAAHTLMLEPYVNLLCLLGIVALFRDETTKRAIYLAGALFGVACTVKLFAVFPFVALVCLMLASRRRQVLAPFLLAGTAAVGLISLPFLICAPTSFLYQALLDQVLRVGERTPLWERAGSLSGAGLIPSLAARPALALTVGILAVCVLGGLVVAAWRKTKPPMLSLETVSLAALLATLFSLLWAGTFYYHYAAALAPWLAMVVALNLPRCLRHRGSRIALGLAALVAFEASLGPGVRPVAAAPLLRSELRSSIPSGSCVVADSSAYTVVAGRFSLPRGCPDIVDSFGTTMDLSGGITAELLSGRRAASVTAAWESIFSRAQFVVLSQGDGGSLPVTAELRRFLNANFTVCATLDGGAGFIYRNDRN